MLRQGFEGASRAPLRLRRLLSHVSHDHGHHQQHQRSQVHDASDAAVRFLKEGHLGEVVLNRPKALNALNLDMVRAIDHQFRHVWNSKERGVAAVWLAGAGGKAFCAGGDIKTLWEARGAPEKQDSFFREEYVVDYLLARDNELHRPHIACYDGAVMGGGVGISIHASFRVATERTVFAMPETAIGFFPDVGGSFFLPRLPLGPAFGLFLALSGHRLAGADAVHAGVATHFVPSADLPRLRADVVSTLGEQTHWSRGDAAAALSLVLNKHAAPLPQFTVTPTALAAISAAFSEGSVDAVVAATHAAAKDATSAGSPDAAFLGKAAKALSRGSPTSLRVTFEQMRRGANLTLAECLRMELRVALHAMSAGASPDFYEGVRAVLVDKDNSPVWSPATLEGVHDVSSFFAPLKPASELHLPA
jgi:enoyl-CoA hydratase